MSPTLRAHRRQRVAADRQLVGAPWRVAADHHRIERLGGLGDRGREGGRAVEGDRDLGVQRRQIEHVGIGLEAWGQDGVVRRVRDLALDHRVEAPSVQVGFAAQAVDARAEHEGGEHAHHAEHGAADRDAAGTARRARGQAEPGDRRRRACRGRRRPCPSG